MIAVYAPQRRLLAFHGLSKVERCPRVNHLFSPAFFLPLPRPFPSFLFPPFVVSVSGSSSSLTLCYRHYCKLQGYRSATWHNKTKDYRPLSAGHRTTVFDVRCVCSRNRGRVRFSSLLRHSSVILLPAAGTSSARSWTRLRYRINLRAGEKSRIVEQFG